MVFNHRSYCFNTVRHFTQCVIARFDIKRRNEVSVLEANYFVLVTHLL